MLLRGHLFPAASAGQCALVPVLKIMVMSELMQQNVLVHEECGIEQARPGHPYAICFFRNDRIVGLEEASLGWSESGKPPSSRRNGIQDDEPFTPEIEPVGIADLAGHTGAQFDFPEAVYVVDPLVIEQRGKIAVRKGVNIPRPGSTFHDSGKECLSVPIPREPTRRENSGREKARIP